MRTPPIEVVFFVEVIDTCVRKERPRNGTRLSSVPSRDILIRRIPSGWRETMKRFLPLILLAIALFVLVGNAQAGKKSKVYVCHKEGPGEYKTLRINTNALSAHLNHGDVEGRCEDIKKESAVAIFRCGSGDIDEGSLLVTGVSLSLNVPTELTISLGDECADANASLLNGGFDLGDAKWVGDGTTEYMYIGKSMDR
jgi:hypothetical protein